MKTRQRIEAALAKPLPEDADFLCVDDFDPWRDVIEGIAGHYAAESDSLMIEALEAVRDGRTFEFIDEHGFAGEFILYVLSGHGLIEYGTSPRGGWPEPTVADLWQPLIDKWNAYASLVWPNEDPEPIETAAPHDIHRQTVDTIIEAMQAYLPPDGIAKDEFISRVIGAVDNPDVALATRRRSCSCVDVEIQAYRSQGLVKIPEHMQALRDHRRASGNPMWEWLSIDGCLIAEIRDLWDAGIRTTGCCCGHNVADPFIGVEFDDIEKMKALGYQVAPNPSRPGDEDSFYPKSIRRYDH